MTHKALLAESLDVLRQCEQREHELDQARQRAEAKGSNKSPSHAHVALELVRGYEALYQRYLCGLQMMNYVRHLLLATNDASSVPYAQRLVVFCASKLTAYMDRAEQLLNKLNTILVAADKVAELSKPGYVMVKVLYNIDGATTPLTMMTASHTFAHTLSRGTYMVVVKNNDDYSVAAPNVRVTLDVRPDNTITSLSTNPLHAECALLPCGMAWRRVFGVGSSAAAVTLKVKASGMREAHVDVVLQQWCPAGEANKTRGVDGDSVLNDLFMGNTLPPLTDDDIAAMANLGDATQPPQQYGALSSPPQQPPPPQPTPTPQPTPPPQQQAAPKQAAPLPPPLPSHPIGAHVARNDDNNSTHAGGSVPLPVVDVNPANATTRQRLGAVRHVLDAWPLDGVGAVTLPLATQRELQAMYALPLPRDLDD